MTTATELWDVFKEKQYEPLYMRNVLIGLSGIMLFFTIWFMICSFVVSSTANEGFNVVLTGLLFFVWELGTIWLMRKGPQAMSHGFLMGVSIVMFFITIETAIYWGQLSGCDTSYDGTLSQYSCENKAAMRGVAAFASIIWLVQVPFTLLMIQHRNTVTKEANYEDLGAGGDYGYDQGVYGGYGYEGADTSAGPGPGNPMMPPSGPPGVTSDL